MEKGNKCSLQYHKEKYETNFIVEGKARVLRGIHLNKNNIENALKFYNDLDDIDKYFH